MPTSWSLRARFTLLGLLAGGQLMTASLLFDGASLESVPGPLTALLGAWGATAGRLLVGFTGVLVTFAFLTKGPGLTQLAASVAGTRLSGAWLAGNLAACTVFAICARSLYWNSPSVERAGPLTAGLLVSGAAALVAALLVPLRLSDWISLTRILGLLPAYSLATTVLALVALNASRFLWQPASRLTFQLVRLMLDPFMQNLTVEPARLRIATPHFGVIIAPECSGLEGIGLLLLFATLWLWLFRKDCRFPQALLLLPAGVVALFLLNSVRIAVLLVIGHAGAREIALEGFHSQAGWISFNAVAFGLCVTARRLPWITRLPVRESAVTVNPVAPYVLPLLVVIAAGMLVSALSGSFQWLYPLKFLAGLAALWSFRRIYRTWNWSFGWEGPAMGAAVFLLWLTLDRVLFGWTNSPMPAALSGASLTVQTLWISVRAISASTVVPVVEELAFRGCLLRRFMTEEFDALPPTSFSWFSLVASSVIFGGLHGTRWFSGILAGTLYAFVLVRKGRLGDAVVAHATTNALLAGYVLLSGSWQFW